MNLVGRSRHEQKIKFIPGFPGKIPGFPENFPDTDNYSIKTRKIYKKILQIKTMFLVYQKFYM